MAADRPLILSIVGTRPEAIKLSPVIRALAERAANPQKVILTGQHSGLAPSFAFLPADAIIVTSSGRRMCFTIERRTIDRDASSISTPRVVATNSAYSMTISPSIRLLR